MHKPLRGVTAVLVGSLVFGARPVWAQSQSSFAEALYQEGQQLMTAGRFAEACPKLAESHKLEPGAGTLLNLAACNEQLGKTATAWTQFSEVFHLLSTDEQRAAFAQERRDSLATKLSRLAIQVPEAARVPGLVVKLDGVAVGTAGWGVAMPIDPGPHKLEASAQGYEPWQSSVEIAATAESKAVEIPALQALPGTEPASTGEASSDAASTPKEGGRPITTPVKVAGVATIALAVGAGVTGGLYLSKKSKYDEINNTAADPDEIESRKNAVDTMGIVNLALTGGAVAGVATTLILYFTTPKNEAAQTAFVPWVGPGVAGGTLVKRF